jgi:hypothetical protein
VARHADAPSPDGGAGEAELPEPVKPSDVLTGLAAEQAIGESPPPPLPVADPGAPPFLITPLGVGIFELGLPRRAVMRRLGPGGVLRRERVPAGEPTLETAELVEAGVHVLHLVVLGGRLTEVTITARDHRAVTAADIGVGATFEDAILAHGDPRPVGRGWVLSALPGVVFAPADPQLLGSATPPANARVGRIIVVGPESD